MSLEDRIGVAAAVVVLVLMAAIAWWWLPQKWQACQKLYDNRIAQIICFSSK
jgi:hypothetical protein